MDEQKKRLYDLIVDVENEFYRETPTGADSERIEKTADYLIAHGALVPPCKVGDTVYFLCRDDIFEAKVIFIEINAFTDPQIWIAIEYFNTFLGRYEYKSRIDLMLGKIVFLTREEAEAALKGRIKK